MGAKEPSSRSISIIQQYINLLKSLSSSQLFLLNIISLILIGGLLGGSLLLSAESFSFESRIAPIMVTTSTMMVISAMSLRYLSPSSRYERRESRLIFGEYADATDRILVEPAVAKLEEHLLSISESKWIERVHERLTSLVSDERYIASISAVFTDARKRLLDEIASLDRRGNLNLVMGGVATGVGLFILGMYAFSVNPHSDGGSLISYHLPRVALGLFIQLFGFFFLRLYKSSLEGIKYFQNELTNIELRYMSIMASLLSANPKLIASVIQTVSKTERNFVLQKGQTTVEIEKSKIESEHYKDIVQIVKDMKPPKV